ncbi:IPT/TIG domain protein [Ostertagia ostertagi]
MMIGLSSTFFSSSRNRLPSWRSTIEGMLAMVEWVFMFSNSTFGNSTFSPYFPKGFVHASVCPIQNGPPSPASLSMTISETYLFPSNTCLNLMAYARRVAHRKTGCDWCIDSHKCVSSGKCNVERATECVHIKAASQLTIPNGSPQEISFSVAHMDRLPKKENYSCRVVLNGTAVLSKGHAIREQSSLGQETRGLSLICDHDSSLKSSVKCEAMKLNYPETLPNVTAPLEFMQGTDVIDSIEVCLPILTAFVLCPTTAVPNFQLITAVPVLIYSCSLLAADCSSCVFASATWGCSWCSGRCSHDCPQSPQDVVCDRPQIVSVRCAFSNPIMRGNFKPSSGPIEGGTEITITGRDLGSTIDDVKDRVFVAGSRCPVTHYEISKKIVCRVEKGSSSGPVRVTVGKTGSRTAESSLLYSFVETHAFSAYPPFAPVSGGTKPQFFFCSPVALLVSI